MCPDSFFVCAGLAGPELGGDPAYRRLRPLPFPRLSGGGRPQHLRADAGRARHPRPHPWNPPMNRRFSTLAATLGRSADTIVIVIAALLAEIGRATCRERVCQYV